MNVLQSRDIIELIELVHFFSADGGTVPASRKSDPGEFAMSVINVPTRSEVSPANQAIFDQLKGKLGMVPNLYATLAHSEHALGNYLAFQNAKSSITGKAREVVNLIVSQVNECEYCLAAHTVIGGMVGFTPEQVLEIRSGRASFDAKLDALARLVRSIAVSRGKGDQALVNAFLAAGWTKENLVDVIVTIGDKVVTNYLHSTTKVPVDFPAAPALSVRLMAAE
jgi:AhpD family alkylhydroperoxidase